jgi:hypothetical protein
MQPKAVEHRELWKQRISEQTSTQQPVRAFCRERGLKESTFYAWRKRFSLESPMAQAAAPVAPQPSDAAATHPAP